MTISDKKRYIKKECAYKLPWHFESDADFIEYFFWLNGRKIKNAAICINYSVNIIEIIYNEHGKTLKMFTSYIPLPNSYKKFVNAIVNVLYKLIKYLEG